MTMRQQERRPTAKAGPGVALVLAKRITALAEDNDILSAANLIGMYTERARRCCLRGQARPVEAAGRRAMRRLDARVRAAR